jgi:hypothetical protein
MPRKPFQTDFYIYKKKKCYQLGYREILKIVRKLKKFRKNKHDF